MLHPTPRTQLRKKRNNYFAYSHIRVGIKLDKAKAKWENVRHSSRFHNFLLFLLFVGIATLFWCVMVMNDSVQKNIDVTLTISGKPDSITFIDLPPRTLHVVVRDRGTKIFRAAILKNMHIDFNFREYSEDGIFRIPTSDIYSALRAKLGPDAQITATSVDSLHLAFTTIPGKKVPVDIVAHLSSANGFVVVPHYIPSKKIVTVYATDTEILDTINSIKTHTISRSALSKNITVKVPLIQPRKTRVEPYSIDVTIQVEPLVRKEVSKEIKVVGVPKGENVLLFPAMATISVFVPMSRFNDDVNITLEVNYNQLKGSSRKLPVNISNTSDYCVRPSVTPDSVEYTLVR